MRDADGIVGYAALDFEPMKLDGIMPVAEFQESAQSIYTTLAIVERLLGFDPEGLADALIEINPQNPAETMDAIQTSTEWLQDIASVFSCVESRIVIALSKRALRMNEDRAHNYESTSATDEIAKSA